MDDLILKLGGENQVNGDRIGTHSTGLALEKRHSCGPKHLDTHAV